MVLPQSVCKQDFAFEIFAWLSSIGMKPYDNFVASARVISDVVGNACMSSVYFSGSNWILKPLV